MVRGVEARARFFLQLNIYTRCIPMYGLGRVSPLTALGISERSRLEVCYLCSVLVNVARV